MKMNNKMQSYNKQALSIAIILCVMVVLALFIPIQKTYADYSDLNENSVVNFNQLYKITNTGSQTYGGVTLTKSEYQATLNGTATTTDWLNVSISLTPNHKYYYHNNFDFSSNNSGVRVEGTNTQAFYINDFIFDFANTTTYFGYYFYNGKTYNNLTIKPYLIDLTLMFGEGFEPNIAEAKEYFTSSYYNYTTGIAMPYSKGYLQGYQDGTKDMLESLHATYNNDILGTIAYPVNYNDIESTLRYDSDYNRYIMYGIAGLNFGDYITSTITYKGKYFMPNYQGGVYIVFFNYQGGIMNPIATSEIVENMSPDSEHYWDGSCNIQFNINNQDVIYFGFFTSYGTFNDSTAVTMVAWSSELEVQTLNINAIIQSAIAKGQRDVLNQYEPGAIAYESIYQQGFNEGLARENGFGTALELVGTTFSKVGEILQIQILPGIPVGLFVVFPLLVGLIIFIVKMVKGGG